MSSVFFISDTHFGHKNVLKFSGGYRMGATTIEEHDQLLLDRINNRITKRDTLYILGDLVMDDTQDPRDLIKRIVGRKFLVRGNHDDRLNARDYLEVFDDVFGIIKYKKHWVSHAPIHPDELRGSCNIHGHVHSNSIKVYGAIDDRYINVCVEALDGSPIDYQNIINGHYHKIRKC